MPMPTRAAFYRRRNLAIGRKGAYEAEWLADDNFHEESTYRKTPATMKQSDETSSQASYGSSLVKAHDPSSPVSIASTFDLPVELKPITLPDAWVVVGKKGKPLKNNKMYDEPKPEPAKKKKRRTRRSAEEAAPVLVALDETPSSSKCHRELDRTTKTRDKAVTRSQEAKYWAKYHGAKQLKREALEELVAAMLSGDEAPVQSVPKPAKDNKANSAKDKARRRARSAAAAARCFPHDLDEKDGVEERIAKESTSRGAGPRGELLLMFGPRVTHADNKLTAPDAWHTVGKGGKVLQDFPPLEPPAEPSTKRRKSGEGPPQKAPKHEKAKAKSKCLLM